MPDYNASITDRDVLVGRDKGNHFSIEITPASGDLNNVIVRVSIPCGPDKPGENTFLLTDEAARPHVAYRLPGDSGTPEKIDLLGDGAKPEPAPHYLAWEVPSKGVVIGAGTTMKIDVTGFGGNIPPGQAKVLVEIRERGPAAKRPFTKKELPLDVSLQPGDETGLKIHYFIASKDYVLHAGEEEVVLSWHTTTAAKSVTLFKNNTKIWPPHGGSRDLFFKDHPSITSVYRLEAIGQAGEATDDRQKLLDDKKLVVKRLTVQVAQTGWNRQPLHQGYPTVLMKALSFTSGESERLYGVFVNPKTETSPETAGLYSSETGFPPWRKEPTNGKDFGQIQDGGHLLSEMSHSPGVACDNKLWLIGGSSVNPTKQCSLSNQVWYYHKNTERNVGEWVRDTPAPFTPRMGHCCVHFDEKIWVLGGSNLNKPLDDVWSYDYRGRQWSRTVTKVIWPARCMFAAVATPAIAGDRWFGTEKMWVYGGTADPDVIKAKTNLWSTSDAETWKQEKSFELGPLPGQPNGATLFWDDDRLHLAGSFKAGTGGNDKAATLSAMVYSLCASRYLWEANPVSWGWEQFDGNTFLMQALVFNRFWFFWSLNQNITSAPKLNVFIPS